MPIYRMSADEISAIPPVKFGQEGILEADMQRLLKANIAVISPDTLVVAKEFGDWEDSQRRIDLLGIDKAANLVVIELKRTRDGGHMELQSLRYAAMVSTMTFDKLVPIYQRFLEDNGVEKDAEGDLLEFLGWDEADEEQFAQEVKIVLAAQDFSKELTTTVMWLNDAGLDIRCVRVQPYKDGDEILLEVHTVIPVPEAADFQVQIREKRQREHQSRRTGRTKYDVTVNGQTFQDLSRRAIMYPLVRGIIAAGGSPDDIMATVYWRHNKPRGNMFQVFDGKLGAAEVEGKLEEASFPPRWFFCGDDEVFHHDEKTYVLSRKWGQGTLKAVGLLKERFPDCGIEVRETERRPGQSHPIDPTTGGALALREGALLQTSVKAKGRKHG